jgi:hypothetical protein
MFSLICFGTIAGTVPARLSCNDEPDWSRSPLPFQESKSVATYRIAEKLSSGWLERKRTEGIIAKRKSSGYRPGKRSSEWLKIKPRPQQEFIVCGFTSEAAHARKPVNCFRPRFDE